jgi:hypothetical protein
MKEHVLRELDKLDEGYHCLFSPMVMWYETKVHYCWLKVKHPHTLDEKLLACYSACIKLTSSLRRIA